MDQVCVAHFPFLVLIDASLMLCNFRLETVWHLKVIILFDTKLRDNDRRARIDLLGELLQVGFGIFKVSLQARLLDQITERSHRIVQTGDICRQMLIILLQKHGVLAETDQFLDNFLLQLCVLGIQMQSNKPLVKLSCDAQAKDSNAVVHHFLGRFGINSELIAAELI